MSTTKKEKNTSRAAFRRDVFAKMGGMCCVPWCNYQAVDAHHIIDRALWNSKEELDGYICDNGAPLCECHHFNAEYGNITPRQLRSFCRISNPVYPSVIVNNIAGGISRFTCDKWGSPYKRSSRAGKVKYPHTPFFRNSPGGNVSEKRENGIMAWDRLCSVDIVISTKLDGSNVTFDRDGVAARNAHDATHSSFDMLKQWHASTSISMDPALQFFGEWMYAKHSIHYTDKLALTGYLHLFAIYDHSNVEWLGWDDVRAWARTLGIPTVPTLFVDRVSNPKSLEALVQKVGKDVISDGHEGIVVRNRFSFPYSEFSKNIAKYVRKDHVTTSNHWSTSRIVLNELLPLIKLRDNNV